MISVLLTKCQPRFNWLHVGFWCARGPWSQASPTHRPLNPALYCSPVQKLITQSAVSNYDFVHQDHPASSNDVSPSDYYLFWNL